MNRALARTILAIFASCLGSSFFVGDASAKNSVSLGDGVKCVFVLLSSRNNVNVYNAVCRRNH